MLVSCSNELPSLGPPLTLTPRAPPSATKPNRPSAFAHRTLNRVSEETFRRATRERMRRSKFGLSSSQLLTCRRRMSSDYLEHMRLLRVQARGVVVTRLVIRLSLSGSSWGTTSIMNCSGENQRHGGNVALEHCDSETACTHTCGTEATATSTLKPIMQVAANIHHQEGPPEPRCSRALPWTE